MIKAWEINVVYVFPASKANFVTEPDVAGIERLQRYVSGLLGYLERNERALVHYAARHQRGEPISTAFVKSAQCERTTALNRSGESGVLSR